MNHGFNRDLFLNTPRPYGSLVVSGDRYMTNMEITEYEIGGDNGCFWVSLSLLVPSAPKSVSLKRVAQGSAASGALLDRGLGNVLHASSVNRPALMDNRQDQHPLIPNSTRNETAPVTNHHSIPADFPAPGLTIVLGSPCTDPVSDMNR